mmetsp:Transcript_13079/g.33771  ORF Transcript_13079/g.33771 Transcript_13079/m.33771 type:complete len:231 (-) Transcript_13079:96-788(-)
MRALYLGLCLLPIPACILLRCATTRCTCTRLIVLDGLATQLLPRREVPTLFRRWLPSVYHGTRFARRGSLGWSRVREGCVVINVCYFLVAEHGINHGVRQGLGLDSDGGAGVAHGLGVKGREWRPLNLINLAPLACRQDRGQPARARRLERNEPGKHPVGHKALELSAPSARLRHPLALVFVRVKDNRLRCFGIPSYSSDVLAAAGSSAVRRRFQRPRRFQEPAPVARGF